MSIEHLGTENKRANLAGSDGQPSGGNAERRSVPKGGSSGAEGDSKAGGSAKTLRMGSAPVPTLLLEFAIPSIAGMLINSAYNVISAMFLGQAMGSTGLAVTTAAFPLTMLFMALAMLVGNGGNALAALRLGQGMHGEAERVLGNTFSMAVALSVFLAVFATIPPCMELLLSVSSTTPDIHDLTRNYVWILSVGVIFQIIGMGINNFIRTAGAPNRALATMVIGAVSCIFLSWLFVMVLGWGVEGSALATLLGQAISCISVLWYFLLTPGVPMKLRRGCLKLKASLVKEILALGLASFCIQIAGCVCSLLVNYQLVTYGAASPMGAENALAAIGVVNRCAGLAFMPIIGVAAASQPLIGYNYGAGLIGRVRQALGFAILYASVVGLFMWAIVHLWPNEIVQAFGVAPDYLDLTVFALQFQMLLIAFIGVQVVVSNYFQSTGQPVKSIVLSLTRQVIYLIPALVLLPLLLPLLFPIDSLYALFLAWPVADGLAVITATVFCLVELRRLGKLERGEITDRYAGGGAH
ncbi:MAG: MATE family efflux transporter [Coriobacteriia bacterium]|nr:MATE family efflux transporter [Coriobacteriia bacterium]